MIGLIQRLLDRSGATVPQAAPVTPAAQSTSPLAAHDQRLQDPAFRDTGIGLLDFGAVQAETEPHLHDAAPSETRPRPRNEPHVPNPANLTAPTSPAIKPLAWQPIDDPIAALRAAVPIADVKPTSQPAPPQPPPISMDHQPQANSAPTPLAPQTDRRDPPARSEVSGSIAKRAPPPEFPLPTPIADSPVVPPEKAPQPPLSRDPLQPDVARSAPDRSPTIIRDDPRPVARPEAQPELIRPAPPTRAMPDLSHSAPTAPAQKATQERQREVERIIERVTAQDPAPQPGSQAKRRREKPTAQNVSRIGALPTRRRSHTVFGLRRG